MAQYHVAIRRDASGLYGFAITDGRGTKVAGLRGCRSHRRAHEKARNAAAELLALDKALGRRSWIASGLEVV